MSKNKFHKYTLFIMVAVFLALLVTSGYSQYKRNTLTSILPGADEFHADRFFLNYASPTSTSPGSLMHIIGPYPWKLKIIGLNYIQIGVSDSVFDSMKVLIYAGNGFSFGDSLVGDTLIMNRIAGSTDSTDTPFDSSMAKFTFTDVNISNNYGPIDTLMPGYVLSILGINGSTSTYPAKTCSLFRVNITAEFEILE